MLTIFKSSWHEQPLPAHKSWPMLSFSLEPVTFSIAVVQGKQGVYIPRFLPWPTPLPHQSTNSSCCSLITSPSGKDLVESKAFWGPVCYPYSGMPKTQIYCQCFVASQPFLQVNLYFSSTATIKASLLITGTFPGPKFSSDIKSFPWLGTKENSGSPLDFPL